MNQTHQYRLLWLVVLAAALALRTGGAFYWQSRIAAGGKFAFPDSNSYWQLGRAIAAGEPYQYRNAQQQVFRTPGYPLLLAPLFAAAGDHPPVMAARLLGAVLGVITVAGTGRLAFMLFDHRTALLAGGMAAVYPEAVASSVFVLAEAPFCPLMLAHLIAWLHAWRSPTWQRAAGWAVAAGIACGAAVLMRPSWLLFVPFATGLSLLCVKQRVRSFTIGAATLLTMCAVLCPWWVRNYYVTGKFVATTLETGASLYDGLNLRADGGSDMRFKDEFRIAQRAADRRAAPPLESTFEYRLNARLFRSAAMWAGSNPVAAVALGWTKFLRMWNVWPNFSEFRSWPVRLLVLAGYVPLLGAAICGVFAFARRGWPVALMYLPAVYFTLLHMVFASSIRYRLPPMLPLLVLSAAAVLLVVWPWLTGKPAANRKEAGA